MVSRRVKDQEPSHHRERSNLVFFALFALASVAAIAVMLGLTELLESP